MAEKKQNNLIDVPLPGQPVRSSKTGRPIMAVLDLIGRRWSLRILWELRSGPVGFRAIQAKCDGMSPAVLNTRIKELAAAGIISQQTNREWLLTKRGQSLIETLQPLSNWADDWQKSLIK